jgi:hypothetical protein
MLMEGAICGRRKQNIRRMMKEKDGVRMTGGKGKGSRRNDYLDR